ncbi:uncharacterized protein LOC116664220 [Camelus ferus]|uniref:Uncharacterized protein LOC116664220 n=1 Tax=Camelus ferus TaxID=419612 RepID=A0A8B8T701_CAMFR|nr:uncharacterized protein LOC116664220 [Camelus ferus]
MQTRRFSSICAAEASTPQLTPAAYIRHGDLSPLTLTVTELRAFPSTSERFGKLLPCNHSRDLQVWCFNRRPRALSCSHTCRWDMQMSTRGTLGKRPGSWPQVRGGGFSCGRAPAAEHAGSGEHSRQSCARRRRGAGERVGRARSVRRPRYRVGRPAGATQAAQETCLEQAASPPTSLRVGESVGLLGHQNAGSLELWIKPRSSQQNMGRVTVVWDP